MNPPKPFSIDEFLEKLEAGDPEVALDPTVLKGLVKLSTDVKAVAPQRAHLLLVDDNDEDAFLFGDALEKTGIAVDLTRVRDGKEAVDYFEGRGEFSDRKRFPLPHLTILDLDIPRVGGLQVLERIRLIPECLHSVVIVLTGSDKETDAQEAQRLKTSAYLYKPPTMDGLMELVRQLKIAWIDKVALKSC